MRGALSRLPELGFGLGISTNWPEGLHVADALLAAEEPLVNYLEIYPGTGEWLERAKDAVRRWKARDVAMTLHTAALDLWSAEAADDRGIAPTREAEDRVGPVWCTQDLMLTRSSGARVGVLLGAIFTSEAAHAAAARHAACSQVLRTPLLLENAPYQLLIGDMHFGAFFAHVAEAADCGLTLDIGHLMGTAILQGCEPSALLEGYPFDRVMEVHIAGGRVAGRRYVDDHDAPLPARTLELLAHVLPLCTSLRAVTYEVQSPALDELVPRLERVRDVLAAASFEVAPHRRGA
ncbi:MAG: DUF692 family protein [Pseudorhodoferax sp.]